MTGPEHYLQAERLLRQAEQNHRHDPVHARQLALEAGVHQGLAHTALMIDKWITEGDIAEDGDWAGVTT